MKSISRTNRLSVSLGCLFVALLLALPSLSWAWTPFVVDGRCKKSRRSCRSTVGNAGGFGACCDPVSADIQQCVVDNECIGTYRYVWDSSKLPLKWNFAANNMAGQFGYAGITLKQLEEQAKRSFDVWAQPPCSNFRHAYQGQTSNPPNGRDGIVTIFLPSSSDWARLGASGALAFATPYSDRQGKIINADVYMNPTPGRNARWSVPPVQAQNYDYFHTLLHEVGHALGLGHSYSSANVMYYSATGTGAAYKGLSPDDIAGICSLYPATNTCQNDTTCAPCYQCISGSCTAPSYDLQNNCKACNTDADCGSKAACATAPEGNRCLLKCFGDCCPNGYQCRSIQGKQLCVPYTSHCPRLQCVKDADCGANSKCTSNVCEAPAKYDYKQCTVNCTKDSDCTAPYECVTYGTGKQRCTLPCPDYMCPIGFRCQPTQRGQHCVPNDTNYCSCRRTSDCKSGRVCLENNRSCTPTLGCDKRCISQGGGEIGEPCSRRDPTSCAAGLRCETIAVGNRCVQECATKKCPTGFICEGGGVNLCMKEKGQVGGQACDGLFLRCTDDFKCLNVNDGGTFCVETCDIKSACSFGGKCEISHTPPFCQCSTDKDCSAGFACTNLIGGAKACKCKNPPCQTPCGNGTCEPGNGENCETCAKDCSCEDGFSCNEGICKSSAVCGDGLCSVDKGENCTDCPKDCPCGFGSVCAKGKCVAPFCGDGQCDADRSEDCERCPEDCGCKAPDTCRAGKCSSASCGDGKCDDAGGENCGSCAADCACKAGETCRQNACVAGGSCGDGTCDGAKGEDCVSCQKDCGCSDRKVCDKGACVSPDTFCPPAQQELTCETGGRNCKVTCKPGGCGCQQGPQSQLPAWLLLIFMGMMLQLLRRPRRERGRA